MQTMLLSNRVPYRLCQNAGHARSWRLLTLHLQSRRSLATQTKFSHGRPPMPRVHPNVLAITPPTTSTKASSSRRIGSRLLMWFGASLIGLLVIDNFLQYQNAKEAHEKIAQLAKEEEEFRQALLKEWKDKPALFLVKAVFKYKMGGTMGLRGVTVGDVMEVLQENVGPNKGYYLCRTKDSDGQISSIGWYPTSFVEKIELKPSAQKKSKFLGLF